MVILSFILTFRSDAISNNAKITIYNYIGSINKQDLISASKFISKDSKINTQSTVNNIKRISLTKIEDETDSYLTDVYSKDISLKDNNVKVLKVHYNIKHKNESKFKTYETLCTLIEDEFGHWMIYNFDLKVD